MSTPGRPEALATPPGGVLPALTTPLPLAGGVTATRPFEPLQGLHRLAATIALALAAFMNILDLTIANVSVPSIAGAMGVSPDQGTWIVTSYAVSEAIMLPLTGWLAMRVGQRRMFQLGTALFTLASLACAASPSFPVLLAARVAQGVVGAAMIPLAQAMLLAIYPPQQRGLSLGIFSMTTVAAPIIGPLAGGWLTDHLSWHWIFLVNLPVGLLCVASVRALLGRYETTTQRLPVDVAGMALLAVGVGSLQIMLDQWSALDGFDSPVIVGLACMAALALALFTAWTLTSDHPVVDLRLFARRNFLVGTLCLALASVAFFGTNVVVPLWLQTQMGYTAEWAGRTLAFSGLAAVVLGPLVGANMHRADARWVASFGLTVFALFAIGSSRFPPNVDFWTLALSRLALGLALSCLFIPLNTIYLSGLSPQQAAGAAGLSSFMRNIGSSFGTSLLTAMWTHRSSAYAADLAGRLTPGRAPVQDMMNRLHALGLHGAAAEALLRLKIIGPQAALLATNAVLQASAVIALLLVGGVWLARPPFQAARGAGH